MIQSALRMILPGTACLLGACQISALHMAVPANLARTAERLQISGMGRDRGRFVLGTAHGRFRRQAGDYGSHLPGALLGTGSFQIGDRDPQALLTGRCWFEEKQLNFGSMLSQSRRLRLECYFSRNGKALDAQLLLLDTDPSGDARAGTLKLEGMHVAIRSVHQFDRGLAGSAPPLGYVFEHDGRDIGAIDLSSASPVLFASRDPRMRQATILAGLALSVFTDPAHDPER